MKQERARRTHERVLDAAAVEFAEHGYANATLQGVVQRTGMTKGALYGHFSSKEILAATLITEVASTWLDALRSSAEHDPAVPAALDALHTMTLGLARRMRDDVRLRAAVVLLAEAPWLDGGPDLLAAIREPMLRAVVYAQAIGSIDPRIPPTAVVQLLLSVFYGLRPAHLNTDREPTRFAATPEDLWLAVSLTLTSPDNTPETVFRQRANGRAPQRDHQHGL